MDLGLHGVDRHRWIEEAQEMDPFLGDHLEAGERDDAGRAGCLDELQCGADPEVVCQADHFDSMIPTRLHDGRVVGEAAAG